MCVSRVVLSANNCCGRRPKGARRAVPRLPSRDTNFRWAPMTWGCPASSQQGRRCRRQDAFCPASGTGCTSTSIMHQISAARGRDAPGHATTTLGISRRVWRWQNSVVLGGCGPPRISRGSRLGRCDDFLWTARLFSSRSVHFSASRMQHLLAGWSAALAHRVLGVVCESSFV